MAKNQLTPKTVDMSKWYTQVIYQSCLADYAPVKGCMVIRPNGYEIWENIHDALDPLLKKLGIRNAYFPIFIPLSLLNKEAKHVEGFSPELAIVTHGGGEELKEKLAIRPTSETVMYTMYSKWVHSYRDLPLLLNQWNNVVRWEKRTYFFLRTTEFLWQEAHTAHATHEEAWQMVLDGLSAYRDMVENYLAIPVIPGKKSARETFAGAALTTTIEALMPDGKALQAGTSHDLGQNFSQKTAFDIAFQDQKGNTDYAWQTSFGLSTRIIGALIMTHGDDDGLVLPPHIAPIQIAVLPAQENEAVTHLCEQLVADLQKTGVRTMFMPDQTHSLGWRLNEAEIQGTPLTIVIGERELSTKKLTAKVRHNRTEETVDIEKATTTIQHILETIQKDMFAKALKNTQGLTAEAQTYEEFKDIMKTKRGFIKAFWCEQESCETTIKKETKATTRCLPFIDETGAVAEEKGVCIKCGKECTHRWLFAQAY